MAFEAVGTLGSLEVFLLIFYLMFQFEMDRTSDYWQDYSYETYSSKDFDEDSDDVRYGFSKTVMDKSSDEYNLVLQSKLFCCV